MASKRRLRRNACQGKIRYTAWHKAKEAIALMKHKGLEHSLTPLVAYACRYCSGIHVGHRG